MATPALRHGSWPSVLPLPLGTAGDRAPFLRELRGGAAELFRNLGFPSRRLEAWRFTDLRPVTDRDYEPALRLDPGELPELPFVLRSSPRLAFVDGYLAPELSRVTDLPEGVELIDLETALEHRHDLLEAHLGRHVALDAHPFAALNTAAFQDAAVLLIAPGATVTQPIHLVFLASAAERPTVSYPRTLIVAGEGSSASVLESTHGLGGHSFSCAVSETMVGANARLEHVRLQEMAASTGLISLHQTVQERDSVYASRTVTSGGALVRNDLLCTLDGEGAESRLDGLYLLGGHEQADTHVVVRHARPHGSSSQLFKGILDGSARSVFNGRIIVEPGAQKTDATQANRNLLRSRSALARSNPMLEIFADDVRCTHGSTTGQLEEEAIFYLRSRGIGLEEARTLLASAFAREVIDRIPIEAARARAESLLVDRLTADGAEAT